MIGTLTPAFGMRRLRTQLIAAALCAVVLVGGIPAPTWAAEVASASTQTAVAPREALRTTAAGIAPLSVSAGGYCAAKGVYSLDDATAANTSSVRDVVSGENVGAQRYGALALGVTPDGAASYAVTRDPHLGIDKLAADADSPQRVLWKDASEVPDLGTPSAAAVRRVSGKDYFYLGTMVHTGSMTRLNLFAYNITDNVWIGQVGYTDLSGAGSAANFNAGSDIAFDGQGRMAVLWSSGDPAVSSRIYRVGTVPTTAGTPALSASLLTSGLATIASEPWHGFAFDTTGAAWIMRTNTSTRTTTYATVDVTSGSIAVQETRTGFAANDLAGCGTSAPLLTLQAEMPIGRYSAGDQLRLDIRESGTSTDLAVATTTGSGSGVQSPATSPVAVTAGKSYTIAATGANGADLTHYTLSYTCTWSGGGTISGPVAVSAGRAQATLAPIPTGKDGQTLSCMLTARANAVVLTLQASLTNARFAATDQFTLAIRASGAQVDLATATTTSTTTGVQTPAAGPLTVVAGAVYTIAESGAAGATLGNYTYSYGCSWADGTAFVGAGTALQYDANLGRALATLPAIPTGRDGQALTCTITNTAKALVDVPPRIELIKNIESRTSGHQFRLGITRTFDNASIAQALTAGTTNGTQSSTVARGTVEPGVTYTISETAAGTATVLTGYASTFVCTWSGGGELARGVLSPIADGTRLQTMLPAIPGGRNGQTLSCTITNRLTPATALDCRPGVAYAAAADGAVHRVTETAMNTTPAFTGVSTVANALAINMDGSRAFVGGLSGTTVSINEWNAGQASTASVGTTARQVNTGSSDLPSMVAGSIDPTTGVYYFGGYFAGTPAVMRLYAYVPGAPSVNGWRPYWHALNIEIPNSFAASTNNGDVAFDAQGNLYVVWSPSGSDNATVLARVNAGLVPRTIPATVPTLMASGSAPQVTRVATLQGPGTTPFNGVTFDSTGHLYVTFAANGGSGSYKRLDPSTGKEVASSTITPAAGKSLIDMAGCGLPPTMRLQKEIEGRVVSTDQFALQIRADDAGTGDVEVQSATTAGSMTGIQSAIAGPVVVTVGKTYTIREIGARSGGTTDADLAKYITGYTCQWTDETAPSDLALLSTSSVVNAREARVGPVKSAAQLGTPRGKAGQQLVCTIKNTPVFDAVVTARKSVVDVDGLNKVPGVGWTMTATRLATSTTGTTISTPASKTTVAGGAVAAPWTLGIPNSTAVVDLQVAETQRTGYSIVPGSGSGSSLMGSRCTVTPAIGQPRVVLLTTTTATVTGVRAGDQVECQFVNKQNPGSVAWSKVDAASTSSFLAGSEWTLTGPGVPAGTTVVDCVATSDAACPTGRYADGDSRAGRFRVASLSHGDFTLVESKAPAGFVRVATPREFTITPTALTYSFAAAFPNSRTAVPRIPLTGGTPADWITLLGGGLLILALVGAWLHRRRRTALPSPESAPDPAADHVHQK